MTGRCAAPQGFAACQGRWATYLRVSPYRSVGSFRGLATATVAGVDPEQAALASVAVNAVLVVVTAVYVILTWRLARSSSAAAKSAALANVEEIAIDAAAAIVEKLTGAPADRARLSAEYKSVN